MGPVYALSIHADYCCEQSGLCCSSEWDVPVELPVYRRLDAALVSGSLRPAANADGGGGPLIVEDDLPDDAGAMLARTTGGDCVFYHGGSRLCVIHRDLGEGQLPSTCRYFPRLAVRDARGTSISLTHYCPTAAAMLFRDDVPIEIVEAPRAFPTADYEGYLVGPDAWPPLLHPRMLMDDAAYGAWERHMVSRCADETLSPEGVVATLQRDATVLRGYTPGTGSLIDAVAALPADAIAAPAQEALGSSLALFTEVMRAVPDDFKPEPDEDRLVDVYLVAVAPAWTHWDRPLKRYLAAKAFASWTAYQGRGLLTVVRGLEVALAMVRVEATRQCRDQGRSLDATLLKEAIRQADFALNHLAAGDELARRWSRVEGRTRTSSRRPACS
jgi:Fe-S-cluster containining protein